MREKLVVGFRRVAPEIWGLFAPFVGFRRVATENLMVLSVSGEIPARSAGKILGHMCESSLTTIPARDVYRRENRIAPDMCIA